MIFTEHWNKENAQRLSVIIMKEMKLSLLTRFNDLQPSQKTKFNRLMNSYIISLPDIETLINDFDLIVNEDILNESFDPSKISCDGEKQLILTEEQKEQVKEGTLKLMEEHEKIIV